MSAPGASGRIAPPMNGRVFAARQAMGTAVRGTALVAKDGFSARYDLDRESGVFVRPAHKLVGRSYVGQILVLETAKGGVASAWMLREMAARAKAPLAFVFNSVNPILAQGAAFADLTMLAGFDVDICAAIPDGATLEIDPKNRRLRIVG